jgi:ABC-type uncharacterized transport system involved in gliding motility auxiliary subunit
MGPTGIADNDALISVLAGWGVNVEKDLILDLNPIGQLYGFGGQVALVNHYGSQPIVADMKSTFTGFPLARSVLFRNADKTTVEKLFDTSATSFATTNLSSPKINVKDPNNKQGPLTLAVAGSYNTGKPSAQGRFVVVGSSASTSTAMATWPRTPSTGSARMKTSSPSVPKLLKIAASP